MTNSTRGAIGRRSFAGCAAVAMAASETAKRVRQSHVSSPRDRFGPRDGASRPVASWHGTILWPTGPTNLVWLRVLYRSGGVSRRRRKVRIHPASHRTNAAEPVELKSASRWTRFSSPSLFRDRGGVPERLPDRRQPQLLLNKAGPGSRDGDAAQGGGEAASTRKKPAEKRSPTGWRSSIR